MSHISPLATTHSTAVAPSASLIETRGSQPRWMQKCAELVETAKIAMVDDEEMNIEVVQGYLEQEGYRNFLRTTDATQALALIDQSKPDVVLLDVMMPEISGLEILEKMRADDGMCHIPVIVLTTSCDERDIHDCYDSGANSYVQKPVDLAGFMAAIERLKDFWFGIVVLPTQSSASR